MLMAAQSGLPVGKSTCPGPHALQCPHAVPRCAPAPQVRHATLVVQALKEVNELRFVLCPK